MLRTPTATALVGCLILCACAWAGGVDADPPTVVSCGDSDAALGDLQLRTTGTEIEGYDWSAAERTLTLVPVQGPEYPESTIRGDERPDHEAAIPQGDCLLFRAVAPGWYEVDTRGFRTVAEKDPYECGWYYASPRHIEVHADRVNVFDIHASLSCP